MAFKPLPQTTQADGTPRKEPYVMAEPGAYKDFLASLKLHSFDALEGAQREVCPQCKARRKIYCYDCYLAVGVPPEALPTVQLPLHVHIVKHPLELQSKSTAVHAKILARESVDIHSYPDFPPIEDPSTMLLAFPSKDATDVSQVDYTKKYTSIVFVDSTWFQAKQIVRDQRFAGMPHVKIQDIHTGFWRVQRNKPVTHLATIEAIYHFFRQMHTPMTGQPYDGRFDNILFLFAYNYNLIQNVYRAGNAESSGHLKLARAGYIDFAAGPAVAAAAAAADAVAVQEGEDDDLEGGEGREEGREVKAARTE
eukprot:m.49129 g.49129  ORF g.49129 m.49129 type:complete len:309 (+) comp11455_c0_seq1:150-1076(+)